MTTTQPRPLKLLTAVLAALLLGCSARASLIWYGDPSVGTSVFKAIDIEDDNNNYQGNPSPNGSSITTVTDSTYGPGWDFDKAVNDKRAEAHGAAGLNPAIGSTYYIGWRFNLNSTVTDNAIFQWKAYGSPMYQNFPLVLKCVSGALQLHYFASNTVDNLLWSQTISTATWYTAVIKIKVSDQWTGGSVSFWLNGVAETLTGGVTSYACRTFDGSSVDPKWGIYGANSTLVTDNANQIRIGTAYSDVAPAIVGKLAIPPSAVSASSYVDSYYPSNTVDGNLATRWTSNGDGQWIEYDLGAVKSISWADIAFYDGDTRTYYFDVNVSNSSGGPWTPMLTHATSVSSTNLVTYDFAYVTGRYVQIVGHEGTHDTYNNITEVQVWGF